jgi:hypothetical protein
MHLIGAVIDSGKTPFTVILVPPKIGPLCGVNAFTTIVAAETGGTLTATSSKAKYTTSLFELYR